MRASPGFISPEGELTGGPGRGGAGRDGEALRGAGGGGGYGAVTPAVGHHAAVSVGGRGTPGHWAVSVSTLVVRHASVAEGEDTAGACSGTLLVIRPARSEDFTT